MGDCTGAGETITVMITNLCPAQGNAQWCSVPDQYGFGAHFDIMSQAGPGGWSEFVFSLLFFFFFFSLSEHYVGVCCFWDEMLMISME